MDKYTWQDIGSSYLPGELIGRLPLGTTGGSRSDHRDGWRCWDRYHGSLAPWRRRAVATPGCARGLPAQRPYLLRAACPECRPDDVLAETEGIGISRSSTTCRCTRLSAGKRYARMNGALNVTEDLSERLIRLPLWIGLSEDQQTRVAESLQRILAGS